MNCSFVSEAPIVRIVGLTQPNIDAILELVALQGKTWNRGTDPKAEMVSVLAGSSCYASFDNNAGRTDAEYLRSSIVDQGHLSVIEHINVSFGVLHLPRSVQMELIRHRAGSAYSFISQRFVQADGLFIIPPALRKPGMEDARDVFMQSCETLAQNYTDMVQRIRDGYAPAEGEERTLQRKRQKEAARALLPNAAPSSGVVTYNARQLRHVIQMRSDQHADASIREFASQLYLVAKDAIPLIFQDAEATMIDGSFEVKFSGGR